MGVVQQFGRSLNLIMPVYRTRRSTRIARKASSMEPASTYQQLPNLPPPNPTRGRRGGRGSGRAQRPLQVQTPPLSDASSSYTRFTIHWTARQTDLLVIWLKEHSADCAILFSENKANRTTTTERASGKDKTAIQIAIARSIFSDDAVWKDIFAIPANSKKFGQSVANRIN